MKKKKSWVKNNQNIRLLLTQIYPAEQEINFVTFSNQQTDVPVLEHLRWQYQKE